MIRSVKILLVVLVAFWGLIGALGNLSNLDFTYEAVKSVTTMPFFEAGQGSPWKTGNPVVVWLGVAVIVGGKLAAAGAFRYGGFIALIMIFVGQREEAQ